MKIIDGSAIDKTKLDAFKAAEWEPVDKLHFDNTELVDFDEVESMLVALDDDGGIMGYIKTRTEMGTAEIESLIVGQSFRKQGVAASLVAKAEEVCKSLNIHKIWLETGVDWEARDLYKKLGYEEVATLKKHYGHKDFVLMEKILRK